MGRWPSAPGASTSPGRSTPTGASGSKPGVREAGLPVAFSAPVTDHAASDDAGTGTLGEEGEAFWRDHMGAGVNAIRTQTLIRDADVVVVRFGDKYRQWNAAFDAGFAAALGKPIVTLHDPELRPCAEGGRPRRAGDGAHRRAGRRRAALRDHRQAPLARPVYGGLVSGDANRALIERFYEAFGRCDGAAMSACYAPRRSLPRSRPSAISRARRSARCGGC